MEAPLFRPPSAAGAGGRPPYVTEPGRWFVLFSFSVFSCNQCFTWFSFSSLDQETIAAYFGERMDKATIDLLLNWGPVAGVLAFPLQTWVSSRRSGLYKSMWLGILLVLLGNIVRSIPIVAAELMGNRALAQGHGAFLLYHVGQFLNAVGGPFNMGTCTLLSVTWFSERERTVATAIAQTSNGLGGTLGFLNPLWLAPTAATIPRIFWLGLLLAAVPALCGLVYLPARPPQPPSAAAAAAVEQEEACSAAARRRPLAAGSGSEGNRSRGFVSFVTLITAAGVLSGVLDAWQACLQSILNPARIDASAVAWIGFGNSLASNLGAVLCGALVGRCCKRHLKASIIVGGLGIVTCLLWFTLSLPCFLYDEAPLPHSEALLILACTSVGLSSGVTDPLIFELSAELLAPRKESTSAGILVAVLNLTSIVTIQLNTVLKPDRMNFIATVTAAGVFLLVVTCVREEHRRPSDEDPDPAAPAPPPAPLAHGRGGAAAAELSGPPGAGDGSHGRLRGGGGAETELMPGSS